MREWIKTIGGDVRSTLVGTVTLALLGSLVALALAVWDAIKDKPFQWNLLIGICVAAVTTSLISLIILAFYHRKHSNRPKVTQARLSKLSDHLDAQIKDGADRIEQIEQRREEKGQTFDPNNAFEIDALAVPNLQNRMEQGHDMQGKAAWSSDCEISIRNRHLTQGLDDVALRIVNITPPMTASPSHHPRTQDTTLRQVKFSFTDIPPGKPLPGNTTGHIRIFNASRGPMIGGIRKVIIRFFGTWPTNLGTEFATNTEHRLTVEVTGSGVGRKEAQFTLAFSQETDKPVFDIRKVAPPCERATKCAQDTALLLNSANYACSFHAFWRSGAGELPSNESILEACFLLVKNRHEHPFADLDEYVPGKDYYAFFDFLKHDASNAGVYPAEGADYLEAAERWREIQGYPKPSSKSRLKMTVKRALES